jgi:hypothetical protein
LGANGTATSKHNKQFSEKIAYMSEVTSVDYIQAAALWEILGKCDDQKNTVHNASQHFKSAHPEIPKVTSIK